MKEKWDALSDEEKQAIYDKQAEDRAKAEEEFMRKQEAYREMYEKVVVAKQVAKDQSGKATKGKLRTVFTNLIS